MYYAVWLTVSSNGNRLVCNITNFKRNLDSSIFGMLLYSAVLHIFYRWSRADRYSRKKLIICADASIAAVTFVMILLMPYISTEPLLLGALLLMSIIRSIGAGIQSPAVNAVIPQLVPQEDLMRYNGINSTMQSIVQFAAPAAAGVVLTVSSLRSTLMIDILTAIMGIGLFSCIILPKQEKALVSAHIFADMKIGIRYALSHKLIRNLLSVYGAFTFLCVPAGYLSGLLVSRVYGNTYWYLTAVEVVGFGGMVIGGLLMSIWGGFKSQSKTLVVGLLSLVQWLLVWDYQRILFYILF